MPSNVTRCVYVMGFYHANKTVLFIEKMFREFQMLCSFCMCLSQYCCDVGIVHSQFLSNDTVCTN